MIDIHTDDFCKIRARDMPAETHKNILLSFTGIGHAMGGIDVQQPEFFGAGKSFDNIFFISDLTRSWGNALDFAKIQSTLHPHLNGRSLCSLGNSMGGFLSILATSFWPIDTTIAFAPQFSVCPDVIPDEDRWQNYIQDISDFRFPSLAPHFNTTTRYFLFSGGAGPDQRQWRHFPKQDNVSNIVFRDLPHLLAHDLKKEGSLGTIISSCLDGRFSLDFLRARTQFQVDMP